MEKLEQKLVKLIEYKQKDALLNLIYDLTELPEKEVEYKIPKRVLDLKDKIYSCYKKLEFALAQDIADRSEYNSQLVELSKEIVNMGVIINRYTCLNDQMGEYLVNEFKLKDVSNISDDVPLSNKSVVSAAAHFASHQDCSTIEGKFAISNIMANLPIRMTKDKFSDYVTKGLGILIDNLPPTFAKACSDRLKDMFYVPVDSIKEDFPMMYEKISAVYALDTEAATKEDFESYIADVDDNVEALQSIYSLLSIYYNDVNYLLILSNFAIDEDYLFQDEMLIKDFYYSVVDYIENKDDELADTVFLQVSNEIESRFEDSKPLEEEINNLMDGITDWDNLSDELKTTISVNNAVSNRFYRELEEEIMTPQDLEKEYTTEELANDVNTYIADICAELPKTKEKFLKQKFLKNIPCPMTQEEFVDYATYALDGVNDKLVSLVAYGNIFEIVDALEKQEHEHGDVVIVVTNIITNMVTTAVVVMSIIMNIVMTVVAVMSIIMNMVMIVVAVITTTKITIQNKLASLICGLHASHRIYLSDSLVRTFNFVESHTSCVRFIFRFTSEQINCVICGLHASHRIYLSDSLFRTVSDLFYLIPFFYFYL